MAVVADLLLQRMASNCTLTHIRMFCQSAFTVNERIIFIQINEIRAHGKTFLPWRAKCKMCFYVRQFAPVT